MIPNPSQLHQKLNCKLHSQQTLLLEKTLFPENPSPHKPSSLKPQLPANPSSSLALPGQTELVQVPGVSSQAQPWWAVFKLCCKPPPSGVGTVQSSHKATSIPAPNKLFESIPAILLSSRGAVVGAELRIPCLALRTTYISAP